MSPDLERKIVARWPDWFDVHGDLRRTLMPNGFQCGDGWFDLVLRLCERLEPLVLELSAALPHCDRFEVLQVKQKMGSLRFYVSHHNAASLNGERWHAGKPLPAGCRAASRHAEVLHGIHHAPQADCTCGVYATKSLDHLRWTGYDLRGISGEVYLWGTVVEHKLGWRAQFAYPKNFVLPISKMPISIGTLELWLNTLAEYGCDIFAPGAEGSVPLWLRGSGYHAGGLDLLIQRCRRWYAGREHERRIKRGDRVAVLGCGIGVVEQVNEKEAHVVLSRLVLRISRREIIWDELNMRWEASYSGASPTRTSGMNSGWK